MVTMLPVKLRRALRDLAASLLGLGFATGALADVDPLPLITGPSPGTARDVNAEFRIFVESAGNSVDGLPGGKILLPPHPSGTTVEIPCSVSYCRGQFDQPEGLGRSGRLLGRTSWFGSGTGYFPAGATWSASGSSFEKLDSLPVFVPLPYTQVVHGNADDLLVGRSADGDPYFPFYETPVLWDGFDAEPVALAHLPHSGSEQGPYPTRVNDAGEIVGNTEDGGRRAAIWQPPAYALAFLPMLPGGTTSQAHDIGQGGIAVGASDDGSGTEVAVAWVPNGGGWDVVTLPAPWPGEACQEATAINDADDVAGNCTTATGQARGVVWLRDGTAWTETTTLVPSLSHDDSFVYGLNEHPVAVGRSGESATGDPVLWNLGEPLPEPPEPSLVPVLSPTGLAVLALGFTATGWLGARRRRSQGPPR